MVPPLQSWLSVECDGQAVIDHEGPTPLYVQVADAIAARIDAGDLPPNRPIPSENQLVQEYGVARGTARKAIQLLRERGLVITVVGRGTYVAATNDGPTATR
jgi:GntR family transcriptional regulator